MTVKQARLSSVCCGCGEPKESGENALIVCWDCFKYRTDIIPFKYFGAPLQEWLDYIATMPSNPPASPAIERIDENEADIQDNPFEQESMFLR